ncbi:Nup93/Nic96-domain-containing protein [Coniochaeta sp. 2T2.1]|nr:Nup93/Nic96-domain-containing protein [Coniochaeta sp. 2T2.1]
MSFFNKPAGGGGLFGTPATSQPSTQAQPAGTGLFGSLNMGTNTSTTQTQPTSSLFGASLSQQPQQQQQKTGLFGGLNTGTQQNTTTSNSTGQTSLFSTPATNQQQQQQQITAPAFGASLFGQSQPTSLGLNQSQAQPQQNQNQAPTGGAYFDSLLAKSKKQAEGESALEELPSLQLGLGDLRQRLRKLGPGRASDRPIDGKAHYLLAASGVDPGAAVKDLGAAFGIHGRSDRPTSSQATGELDVETYLNNLQTKTTLSMIADGLERSVRDFDTFLEDNVTMEWEAQRKRIYQHFGIKPREETPAPGARAGTPSRESQGGFGRSRRKSTQAATGPKSAQKNSTFGRSSMHKSLIGAPSRIGARPTADFSDMEGGIDGTSSLHGVSSMDDRFLREKQTKLAEKIHYLNDARQHGQPVYLLAELAELEEKSGDRHAPHMVDAYRALMEILEEDPEKGNAPRQRQYAKMYLDPNPNSANAVTMRKRILKGATDYLEKQFFREVESLIAKYPQDANLGGRPDVVSKIKAYIRLRSARKTLVPDNTTLQEVGGDYVWAVVYYLLRGGHVNEAAQYVNNNQNHFRSIDRSFPTYINTYAASEDRRLKRAVQERCNNEYAQRVRNAPDRSIDPFRMACYKIIGRCEVNNRTLEGLTTDVNDWIWLQFNLAREGDRSAELATEMYGLNELQTSIREIGLKHFPKTTAEDTNGSFGMFFYLQILSGMFEQAIAYLYPFSYVDAVHFAIALEYYGLLRPADAVSAGNELLSHNTRGLPQINFGRMVGYYTRDFRAADVAAAVDYLILICLNADDAAGMQHAALCHEALRELVLETREFSKLIGDIRPDGQRIKGMIEERGSLIALGEEQEFVKTITLQAASFADDNGRTTDAVLLYHLAGDYDTVVAIASRALSEAISLDIGEDPMRLLPVKPRVAGKEAEAVPPGSSLSLAAIDDPVELARTMMTMYERDHSFWQRIRDGNRVACSVLLQMSEIKVLVEGGRWPQCLDKIRALEILPLDAKGDPSIIRNYASKFSGLSQPVAINVPNLLMWTIICCQKQRERLVGGQFTGNESTARMLADELKQISVDLTTYTSQLRYRFPPHLHEALARASAD